MSGLPTAKLANVTTRIGSGVTPRGGSSVYQPTGRPFIRSQNVGWGDLRLDDLAYIDDATHDTFPATEVREGDVLLNITGASIGRSAVATAQLDGGNVNQHVCEIRVRGGLMNPHFVCAVLNSRIGQDQIDSFQAGGNRQGLNFQQVGSIEIPMPRIGEQDAIAEALTDADGLIYSLRELIAKKRAIKQGMMQELLTGRTRLPGFAGAWTPVIFGDIATPSKERSDPSVTSGRVVELEHISARTGRLIGDSDLASSVSLKTRFLKGDVLFGKLRAYLRKYWLADRDGYASTEIWALRPRTGVAISAFLRYVVEQDDFIEAASTAYGTHMPRSDWKVVSRYELELPTLDEQAAIGLALQSSDAEIAALERRLEATRDIKQSMMQELLTGRTRLVPTEASA
ncbi:hypothetical protein GCM10009785_14490 [Brooklawnia cerclae]|nr:restriction endonuclease subunit S [Brooklawnia cerclae]